MAGMHLKSFKFDLMIFGALLFFFFFLFFCFKSFFFFCLYVMAVSLTRPFLGFFFQICIAFINFEHQKHFK